MAKTATQFVCQACGASYRRWQGLCESCGEWNTLVEESAPKPIPKGLSAGKGRALAFTSLNSDTPEAPRAKTGMAELDRVLGGGLVQGSAILIGGDPGIGKSTLLLQAAAELARAGGHCHYVSGEEAVAQVALRARRLGLADAPVQLAAANSLRDILAGLEEADKAAQGRPRMVVIDSIQTIYADNLDSAPGTVAQVRAASQELVRYAKASGASLFLVGHVTKDGQIAGPRVVEHMVDTVLYFEGERGHPFRILRAVKNRFGATDEIGVFAMSDAGLREVANPSALFLGNRDAPVPGAAVFAGIEGSRPLLVEMQALVAPTPFSTPRRAVVGWDSARLAMILAVIEARLNVRFWGYDVYLNVAGGLKIVEPAADLAAAAALLSALAGEPAPDGAVFFGEISLSGEVRPVSMTEGRLKEAAKLGFRQAVMPKGGPKTDVAGLSLEMCERLDALLALFPRARANAAARAAAMTSQDED